MRELIKVIVSVYRGNCTTHGYVNSWIAKSRTSQLADRTSRGQDNSLMSPPVVVVIIRLEAGF